jgi:hypothetical protein
MVDLSSPPGYGQRSAKEDYVLIYKRSMVVSLFGWLMAWAFWLSLTYRFHPTFALALIVTTSLIVAFAAASYCNHLIFVPRYWTLNRHGEYVCWLAATMAIFTAIALAIIRTSYFEMYGPDADPYGVYKHFAIDLLGMIVHVAIAAAIVWLMRTSARTTDRTSVESEQGDARKSPVGRDFES